MAIQIEYCPEEAHTLADHRCQSRTEGPHAQPGHEHQIQHQIDHRGYGDENKGVLGIAHASENGADQVIAVDEHQTQHAGHAVLPGIVETFRRGIHGVQECVQTEITYNGQSHGADKRHGEHGADGTANSVPVACTDVLGQDHLSGVGEAHHQKCEEMQHVAADGYCGKSLSAHKLPDDDHIHHVVDRLEQVGAEQGECKD